MPAEKLLDPEGVEAKAAEAAGWLRIAPEYRKDFKFHSAEFVCRTVDTVEGFEPV